MHPLHVADDVQLTTNGQSSNAHSLSVIVNLPQTTPLLLSIFSQPLRYLSIYTESALDPVGFLAAFRAFSNLEELRFDSNIDGDSGSEPFDGKQNLWFDNLLPSPSNPSGLTTLRLLSLSDQVVYPSFIRRLPANLVEVEYLQRSRAPDRIISDLTDSAMGSSAFPDWLKEVRVVLDEDQLGEFVTEEEEENAKEAFARRGITLTITEEMGDIPRRRLIHLCAYRISFVLPFPLLTFLFFCRESFVAASIPDIHYFLLSFSQ